MLTRGALFPNVRPQLRIVSLTLLEIQLLGICSLTIIPPLKTRIPPRRSECVASSLALCPDHWDQSVWIIATIEEHRQEGGRQDIEKHFSRLEVSCQIYLASKQCRDAEPVAFHLELLGDSRQGNNQHRNGTFTQSRIENESSKAET